MRKCGGRGESFKKDDNNITHKKIITSKSVNKNIIKSLLHITIFVVVINIGLGVNIKNK